VRIIQLIGLAVAAGVFFGCQSRPIPVSTVRPLIARVHLETLPGEISVAVQLPQSGVSLNVAPKPVFSEYDIGQVEVARVELGLCLLVQLTPAATRDLYRLSVPAQGRRLVVSLDGIFLGVHRIDHAMADGLVPVFLEISDEQLPGMAARINFTSTEMARGAKKTANP
jgi:hypothetical protein